MVHWFYIGHNQRWTSKLTVHFSYVQLSHKFTGQVHCCFFFKQIHQVLNIKPVLSGLLSLILDLIGPLYLCITAPATCIGFRLCAQYEGTTLCPGLNTPFVSYFT